MKCLAHFGPAVFCLLVYGAEARSDASEQRHQPPANRERRAARAEGFLRQRAYPLEDVPAGAALRAWEQTQIAGGTGRTPGRKDWGSTSWYWEGIGPAPIKASGYLFSGRVTTIAVDPSNVKHWLIGTAQGGIWESTNSGASWLPRSDDQPSLAMGAIAFAPSDPRIVYAGTGEANFTWESYAGAGLLKSTDGGAHWSTITTSPFVGLAFSAVRVDPNDPNVISVATTRGYAGRRANGVDPPPSPPAGVFLTKIGGLGWSRTLIGQATALEVNPSNFLQQYAGLGEINGEFANGVYRSMNGAQTWSPITGPWSSMAGVGRIALAIAPSRPDVVYVSIQDTNTSGLLGIWQTGNAWDPVTAPTWTVVTPPTVDNWFWFAHVLTVNPTNANIIYLGEVRLHKRDGGSWTTLDNVNVFHDDQHALAWAGDRIIVGNDGGIWYGLGGVGFNVGSLINRNAGLGTIQFYEGSVHPTDSTFALGGSQDNGQEVWTGDPIWQRIADSDGADNAIARTNPDKHWATSGVDAAISRTRDGAKSTPAPASSGLSRANSLFISRFEECPSNDNVFILGTDRIWRCNDFFSALTPSWLTNGPHMTNSIGAPARLSALAFGPPAAGCDLYAYGTEIGQLRLTTNGGAAFWQDADPTHQVPGRYVSGMAFDPINSNILYVTLSGFDEGTPGQPGHLFQTTNALAASPIWFNKSPPVNLPHNCLLINPTNASEILAGTDLGVWASTNAGNTWLHLGPESGLPNAAVFELKYHPDGGAVAFTYGRGAFVYRRLLPWIIPVNYCPPPCVDISPINPGDLILVNFTLRNLSSIPTANLTATLLQTPGIQPMSGPQSYGVLSAGGQAVARGFYMQAAGSCGDKVTATLQLEDNGTPLGTADFVFELGLRSPLAENFDALPLPNLPAGWTSSATGAGAPWSVTNNNLNQSVFAPDSDGLSDISLDSPSVTLTTASAQLTFDHAYDFEAGHDGGVLEVSIGGGPFVDILSAQGAFAANGYNSQLNGGSALAGRAAWSGTSDGYITSVVQLPASAANQPVQFRWRCASDASGGAGGWFIDSLAVQETACLNPITFWPVLTTRLAQGVLTLTFATVQGRSYIVEYKTLVSDPDWQTLATVPGNGNDATVQDPLSTNSQRFYRVRVP
ncbi:MAG: hypothetical protein C5B50_01955 [Verrucomicrobia bacterium]|nr:MAG: hypothetical protein C5B50_01955 [Verrucomicrobiota bacterium]